jgi:hypothetical protein
VDERTVIKRFGEIMSQYSARLPVETRDVAVNERNVRE